MLTPPADYEAAAGAFHPCKSPGAVYGNAWRKIQIKMFHVEHCRKSLQISYMTLRMAEVETAPGTD